jgi:predicted membrane protein
MKRIAPALFIVLGISAFTCGNVWAQATAQINGVVRDQTGAIHSWCRSPGHTDRYRSGSHCAFE